MDLEIVVHVLSLGGKLEFLYYLSLSLVPHFIENGSLGGIYTNSSHDHCYECWAMGYIPTRTHTCRIDPG